MRIPVLIAAALLSGCVAASRPITIAQALDELQHQLQAAGGMSATGADPAQFALAARTAQCQEKTANPSVPFLAHEISVNLTGSFTATGSFAVGPPATGGPAFGLSAGGSRAQGQSLTLPLTYAALSDLPDVVTAQRAALYSAWPKPAQQAAFTRLLAERDALQQQADAAIRVYDPGECPK